MIRSIIRKIASYPRTDINKLLAQAVKFPRYKKHFFIFRGMKFNVTDFLSVSYQLQEYFVDGRMTFESNTPSPVIYDCGANVGVSVLFFKKIFPAARILAFEPDPNVFNCLKQNIQLNKVEDVELIEKAAWITNDGVKFGSEGADGGSVFFEGNKMTLPSVRLKELLSNEKYVTLLKMDIEGAEVEVLNDCKSELHKIKYLFVEYHSIKHRPQELDQLLKTLSENSFRYQINSIGHKLKRPFIENDLNSTMDIQLDIYAINTKL